MIRNFRQDPQSGYTMDLYPLGTDAVSIATELNYLHERAYRDTDEFLEPDIYEAELFCYGKDE